MLTVPALTRSYLPESIMASLSSSLRIFNTLYTPHNPRAVNKGNAEVRAKCASQYIHYKELLIDFIIQGTL